MNSVHVSLPAKTAPAKLETSFFPRGCCCYPFHLDRILPRGVHTRGDLFPVVTLSGEVVWFFDLAAGRLSDMSIQELSEDETAVVDVAELGHWVCAACFPID